MARRSQVFSIFNFIALIVVVVVPSFAVSPALSRGAHSRRIHQFAGPAFLVKDINPIGASLPYELTDINGSLLFLAFDDDTSGYKLWKSDGTAEGTSLVKDISPSASDTLEPQMHQVTKVNDMIFFVASDGVHGAELWKSDGTTAGTMMVKDIWPGLPASSPSELTNVNGTFFFTANDGATGKQLWKSDGTEAGTERITPVGDGSGDASGYSLTDVNGTLFFMAGFRQLWKSDGSAAGTTLVKDLRSVEGVEADRREELVNVDGTLFFMRGSDFFGDYQLWKSDGAETGTVLLEEYHGSRPRDLMNVNGALFFSAGGQLWKSDGTEAGTVMVTDLGVGSGLLSLTSVNGTLFFAVSDQDPETGHALWTSDGTPTGTMLIKQFQLSTPTSRTLSDLTNVNGMLVFSADDGVHGAEPWKSDGTATGTTMIQDIAPDVLSSSPALFTRAGDHLHFSADDGDTGDELWALPFNAVAPQVSTVYLPMIAR